MAGFFFASSSSSSTPAIDNSGYLGCIVPQNCLNPPSKNPNPTKPTSQYPDSRASDYHHGQNMTNLGSTVQNQPHSSSSSLAFLDGDFTACFNLDLDNNGLLWSSDHHVSSWGVMHCSDDELSTMINTVSPMTMSGTLDGGDRRSSSSCMGGGFDEYPYNNIMENFSPSYGLIPQAINTSATCSPSIPTCADVVDFGYSLF